MVGHGIVDKLFQICRWIGIGFICCFL